MCHNAIQYMSHILHIAILNQLDDLAGADEPELPWRGPIQSWVMFLVHAAWKSQMKKPAPIHRCLSLK